MLIPPKAGDPPWVAGGYTWGITRFFPQSPHDLLPLTYVPLPLDPLDVLLRHHLGSHGHDGHLVGGFNSEKYQLLVTSISQLGLLFPIYGKIKNVPNHQADEYGDVPTPMEHIHVMGYLPFTYNLQ